jgi:preprotein translocase subunit SecA
MMGEKQAQVGEESLMRFEKYLLLQILDHHWKEHLLAMDHLRQSVGLRGYAQKQPLQEYKQESFELFASMIERVREETMQMLHQVQVERAPEPEAPRQPQQMNFQHGDEIIDENEPPQPMRRDQPKVGRNDPCPCGSGKKYKHCHGAR